MLMISELDRFRHGHHLADRKNRILYCYCAKNACSTLKYHFLKNCEGGGAKYTNLHGQAKHYSLLKHSILNFNPFFKFFIIRNPLERIVSAFLDKFVRDKIIPDYARKFMTYANRSVSVEKLSFNSFVSALKAAPLSRYNEHWMPQYVHLYDNITYNVVLFEALRCDTRLRDQFGDLSKNVREHSTNYMRSVSDKSSTPIGILRREFKSTGFMPSTSSFLDAKLEAELSVIFHEDLMLYEEAWIRKKSSSGLRGPFIGLKELGLSTGRAPGYGTALFGRFQR